MIQVSESRVAEELDDFAERAAGDMSFDVARGAVFLALRLNLISGAECSSRISALHKAQFGPKKEDA